MDSMASLILIVLSLVNSQVNKYAGFDQIEDVFYSRKNYKRPELQLLPHRNFEEEVNLLDTFFTGGCDV